MGAQDLGRTGLMVTEMLVGAMIMLIGLIIGLFLGAALVLGSRDRNHIDE